MKNILPLVTLFLIPVALPAGEADHYLTADGKLKHTLEFRDEQGGIAGFTGTAWVIEADGSWQVGRTFMNQIKGEPLRKGQLSAKQLQALGHQLRLHKLHKLPEKLGEEPRVNPHQLTLRFGEHTSRLIIAPMTELTEAVPAANDDNAKEYSRFIALAVVIQHWAQAKADSK